MAMNHKRMYECGINTITYFLEQSLSPPLILRTILFEDQIRNLAEPGQLYELNYLTSAGQ